MEFHPKLTTRYATPHRLSGVKMLMWISHYMILHWGNFNYKICNDPFRYKLHECVLSRKKKFLILELARSCRETHITYITHFVDVRASLWVIGGWESLSTVFSKTQCVHNQIFLCEKYALFLWLITARLPMFYSYKSECGIIVESSTWTLNIIPFVNYTCSWPKQCCLLTF